MCGDATDYSKVTKLRVYVVTVISTFAGCGGSSLGYKMAGFTELLAIDWSNQAEKVFTANFPDVHFLE